MWLTTTWITRAMDEGEAANGLCLGRKGGEREVAVVSRPRMR